MDTDGRPFPTLAARLLHVVQRSALPTEPVSPVLDARTSPLLPISIALPRGTVAKEGNSNGKLTPGSSGGTAPSRALCATHRPVALGSSGGAANAKAACTKIPQTQRDDCERPSRCSPFVSPLPNATKEPNNGLFETAEHQSKESKSSGCARSICFPELRST